jgi:hypothetical protein
MDELRFNTAIAKLIELNNHLTKLGGCPVDVAEPLVLMVAPLAAHVAEELWAKLGHEASLAHEPFPVADPAMLVADTIEYPVQVNGKVRGHITVAADLDVAGVEAAALADQKVVPRSQALLRRRSSSFPAGWSTSSPEDAVILAHVRAAVSDRTRGARSVQRPPARRPRQPRPRGDEQRHRGRDEQAPHRPPGAGGAGVEAQHLGEIEDRPEGEPERRQPVRGSKGRWR